MNLNFMSPLVFGVGAAALLGGLFFMQRLRVRHRTIVVPTTLFWKQAIDEAQVRVFRDRFRHPWAYLLIASIALLVWLAAADMQTDVGKAHRHIILLDQGVSASHQEQWAQAVALVEEQVGSLPESSRWVYAVGRWPRLLLDADESEVLLEGRMTALQPMAVRSSIDESILALADRHADAERITFHIVGGGRIEPAVLEELDGRITVRRLTSSDDLTAGNAGIAAIGSGPARSGKLNCADVMIRIKGAGVAERAVRVDLDGAIVSSIEDAGPDGNGGRVFTVRDIPANGGLLTARLEPGDLIDLDDSAQLVIPDLSPVDVFVEGSVHPAILAVVEADPNLRQCTDRAAAAVAIGNGGDSSLPRFVVAPRAESRAAFQLSRPGDRDPALFLEFVLGHLAVDEIDAMGLAQGMGQPVGVAVAPGPIRRIDIWSELIAPDLDLFHSRALPIFVARSLRWLAGRDRTPTFVTAGMSTPSHLEQLVDSSGHGTFGVDGAVVLPEAGVWKSPIGHRLAGSVSDERLLSTKQTGNKAAVDILSGTGDSDWLTILAGLALVLLALEWFFLTRERIP